MAEAYVLIVIHFMCLTVFIWMITQTKGFRNNIGWILLGASQILFIISNTIKLIGMQA